MIINGNTFAYGAFQLDTRPLYITFTHDSATSKYVPDVDYTAQQIIEMSNTRQVIAKIMSSSKDAYFAPLISAYDNGENSIADFILFAPNNPVDLSSYVFARAHRDVHGWEAEWNEV